MDDRQELDKMSGSFFIEDGGQTLFFDDLKADVHAAEEDGYWAEVPSLPGCLTQGETLDEIVENIDDAIQRWLSVQTPESLTAQGVPFTISSEAASPQGASRRGPRVRTLEFAA